MSDFIPFPQLVRQLELLADAHVLNATPIGAHVKDTMRASAAFVDANVLVYRCTYETRSELAAYRLVRSSC